MTNSPFLTVDLSCDKASQMAKHKLSLAGLRAVQTFDLHAARVGMHDCPCPNHGREDCDCQMVILLVYGDVETPASLILHGNEGQTWLSIADEPRQRVDPKLLAAIKQALDTPVSIPHNR